MALTDENILIIAMYVLSLGILIALGQRKSPMFFILAGIIGIILSIEVWTLTNATMPNAATILTAVLIGMSSLLILFGAAESFPGGESS